MIVQTKLGAYHLKEKQARSYISYFLVESSLQILYQTKGNKTEWNIKYFKNQWNFKYSKNISLNKINPNTMGDVNRI